MPPEAIWTDYPASAAWMMQHVSAYVAYSGNVAWYQSTGYPLLKGVALFWLDQLQADTATNDGTLVAAPCNSPEQGPTTFGCAHFQQVIWEVFDAILSTWPSSGDSDTAFRDQVHAAWSNIDTGIHVAPDGLLRERKSPQFDSLNTNNTHRHLSHLVGFYPGYAVASRLDANLSAAVAQTLTARGNGDGADANAGWEKAWRAACWAGLNDTEHARAELTLAIETNFAPNGLSMYSARDPPFQIDANFGLVGAMLAMLVRDLPMPYVDGDGEAGVPTVVLGPAIPARWKGGDVAGLRIRGGGSVGFGWDDDGIVRSVRVAAAGRTQPLRVVNVLGDVLATV